MTKGTLLMLVIAALVVAVSRRRPPGPDDDPVRELDALLPHRRFADDEELAA